MSISAVVNNWQWLDFQAAVSMLKQEYKEGETNLKQALDLSIKVLSKTLDTNKLTAEKGSTDWLFPILALTNNK